VSGEDEVSGKLIQLNVHPKYRDPSADEPLNFDLALSEEEQRDLDDFMSGEVVDLDLPELNEPSAACYQGIGNSACYLCVHCEDTRRWWERIRTTLTKDFVCTATRLEATRHPVSGEKKYLERVRGALGWVDALVDVPHQLCQALNPDGHCPEFLLSLPKSRRSEKE